MGVLVFNNVSSKDIGIEVETFPTYDIPEREYTAVHVPGRNGDVIIDNGTFKNVDRSYYISIATYDQVAYHQKMAKVARWLHSINGYGKLEDSYEPDCYRQAYYKEKINFENLFNEAGRGTITFVCKPQKFLKSGLIPIVCTSSTYINNHSGNIALPLIEVTTDNTQGTFDIDGVTITIAANSGTKIIIDSELQDAYNELGANKNSSIVLNSGEFPIFMPGKNSVNMSGGVQSVSIKPNWWIV